MIRKWFEVHAGFIRNIPLGYHVCNELQPAVPQLQIGTLKVAARRVDPGVWKAATGWPNFLDLGTEYLQAVGHSCQTDRGDRGQSAEDQTWGHQPLVLGIAIRLTFWCALVVPLLTASLDTHV